MKSSIHGLFYTVNCEYNKTERMFWTFATILSLGVGILLSYLLLYRYSISPTITTLESYNYPTWKIPFPAVTLCNVNKVRKSAVHSIVEKFSNNQLNASDIESFFKKITALISRDNIGFSDIDKIIQENLIKYINGTVDDIMRMVSQPCSELLINCTWQDKSVDCNQLFKSSKSVEGYCCSFNYNYNQYDQDEQYVGGTGNKDGLTVIMNSNPDDYFSTTDSYYGVKVLIHASDAFPETSILTEVVQPDKAVSLSIDPYYVESEETVRDLTLQQKECLFPDEFSLTTVEKYNYQQCITECRIKTILDVCNCIPFIYPLTQNSSSICDLTDSLCMYNNAAVFSNLLPNNIDENSEMICSKCLPECSEIIYTSSSTVKDLIHNNFSIGLPIKGNESKLHVYYRDMSCIKYRKEAMVTWDSLVASLGGIFGLCLGGSVLSIIELLYHFTFNFFKKVRRLKNNQKKTVPINFIR